MKNILVKQEEEKDCGSACILSILKYYNGYVPLEKIRLDTLTDKKGTTFYNMKIALESYGFDVYGYNCFKIDFDTPVICQVKVNGFFHFIVVYKISKMIHVMDPSSGYQKYTYDDFNLLFTGYYLKPVLKRSVVKMLKSNKFIDDISNIFLKEKFLSLKIILNNLLLIIISFLNINLLNIISIKPCFSIFLLLLVISKFLLQLFEINLVAKFEYIFNKSIISSYCKRILFLPFKYIRLKSKGDLLSRFNNLLSIKDFFSKTVFEFISNSLLFLLSSIFLVYYFKIYYFFFLGISLLYFTILYHYNKKIFTKFDNYLIINSKFYNFFTEFINGLDSINYRKKNYYYYHILENFVKDNNLAKFNFEKRVAFVQVINNTFGDVMLTAFVLFIFYKRIYLNIFGLYLFFEYYKETILFYASMLPSFFFAKNVVNKISGLYDIEDDDAIFFSKCGDINVRNLTIKYANQFVINNFSCKIDYGNKVLIKGKNGSGKSTFIYSLLGLIDNYNGEIFYGDINIGDKLKPSLANMIRFVSCNDVLFKDSILNNIIEGNKFDEQRFKFICDLLELERIVNKRELRYDSIIDDNLSNGEIQLIILARALYSDFYYLFIDEGLSNISFKLKNKIINKLCTYYKDRTIVLITHDYVNVKCFNQIIDFNLRKDNDDR